MADRIAAVAKSFMGWFPVGPAQYSAGVLSDGKSKSNGRSKSKGKVKTRIFSRNLLAVWAGWTALGFLAPVGMTSLKKQGQSQKPQVSFANLGHPHCQ